MYILFLRSGILNNSFAVLKGPDESGDAAQTTVRKLLVSYFTVPGCFTIAFKEIGDAARNVTCGNRYYSYQYCIAQNMCVGGVYISHA